MQGKMPLKITFKFTALLDIVGCDDGGLRGIVAERREDQSPDICDDWVRI